MKSKNEINGFTENIFNTVREPLLVLDKDLRVINANTSFYKFFKVFQDQTIGTLIYDLGNQQWNIPKLKELLEKILSEKTTFDNYEVEHNFTDIGNRILLLNARQIERAFGKEKIILLAFEDITKRKHTEEALSETSRMTSEYLDILVNHAHVPIIIWDASFVITRFNHCFEELSGYNISEVIGKKIDFLFPVDKIDSTLELLKNNLGEEKFEIIEIDILRKDKDIRTVLWNSANVFDKDGRIIIATIAQDITKRKLTEELLIILETRYRRLFESAKDGILILNAETGMIIDVNPYLIELLGYSRDKFVKKAIWEIGFFKDVAANESKFFELQRKEYVRYDNLPLKTEQGRKINVEFVSNVYLVNQRKVIQCNIRDITERKQTEEKLRESEEKYRAFFENSMDAILLTNPDGRETLSANPAACKLFGYKEEEFIKLGRAGIVDTTTPQLSLMLSERAEKGKAFCDLTFIRKDGTRFSAEVSSSVFKNHDGSERASIIIRDITERKHTEEKLRQSEEQFRKLYKNAKIGLYRTTPAGNIIMANNELVKMLGYPSFEVLASSNIDKDGFGPSYPRKDFIEMIEKDGEVINLESEWIRLDGTVFFVSENAHAIRDSNNNILYFDGVVEDITERKRTEDEITMLAHALRSINECVSITDLNDKILFINKSFLNNYGYEENELIGKQITMVRSKKNIQEYEKEILPATIRGEWKGELLNERKDGSEFPVFLSTTIINDKEGTPLGLIGVASDISERKKMVDDLLKLSSAVEQSPASIIITDIQGNIEYANPKVTETTGYQFSELKGKNPRIFGAGEKSPADYKLLWDTISSGKEWHGEFHNKKKNGEFYWESASISAIKNNVGEILHYLAVKEDITEKQKMNDELIASKEKAEEMNRLKSNFLANMSHELRTPLVGILGYADIIRQENASPEIKAMAETICKSGNRLSETLNLILDLSRFESEKKDIKFQKIEIVGKTKEIISLFSETARKKGIELNSFFSNASIFIDFDERAYYSILNNLINNAVKYTSEGSITTTLSLNNHFIEITVVDTGIGIAKEDSQTIFDEFRQASEGYSRNFEGSGLGLSITKKLVEKFGGTITVESEIGKGSTFKVKLPVTNSKEKVKKLTEVETKIAAASPGLKSGKPLALLVDDDPFVFQVLKRYAKDYVEMDTTVDAEFAVKILKKKKYDIIFMDINLRRGMDGKQATSLIRKMKGYEYTPIIATTAYAMEGDKEEFILAGCSHYLSKPFNKTEIIVLLNKLLNKSNYL